MITITKEEYLRLKLRDAELCLLEAGGVDNWEYYGDSLYRGDETLDDILSNLRKELNAPCIES